MFRWRGIVVVLVGVLAGRWIRREEGKGRATYRHIKEHIGRIIQTLEPARVVRELIPRIGLARVAQEDALHLPRELCRHGRVIAHHVRVARVGHQHEFPLRIGLEDLLEQKLTDRQSRTDVAEVEGPRVEAAAGVGLVDEVHVVAGDLLGRGGEVVEVEVGDGARPVGVDVRHVHPGGEGAGEAVEETFRGLVDLGDAQDVVDVGDDGQAGLGNQIGGGVTVDVALGVDVQALDVGGGVAG